MKKVRIAVCLIFVISCLVFGLYYFQVEMAQDRVPPVISCTEDTIYASVNASEEELLAGITAMDDRDGDITDSVRISSMSHFAEEGKRTIRYIVFDAANQAGTLERTLIYTDYEPPRIYLSEPLRYYRQEVDTADLLENMTATDCLDGDLTRQIRMSPGDDYYNGDAQSFLLNVQVNNSAGDVCALVMNVKIVDQKDAQEQSRYYPILSEYIVYTKVGQRIDPRNYLLGLENQGTAYFFSGSGGMLGVDGSAVMVQGSVNYSNPGVYPVYFSFTTEAGVTATTTMYVVVEE